MSKIVSINQKREETQKADLLEVLEEMKKQIESGTITEFVAASIDEEGDIQIHANVKDIAGGVGLFEIGKKIFIESAV
jgi:hypothetical protein